MSFARFAMRTAALHALRGATLVGDNVKDSDFSAIDIGADGSLRTDADRPFILIYTDESKTTDADLRDLRSNGALDIVFEFGIASAMTEIDNETGESQIVGIGVPATDATFELTLDMIDRQIATALTGETEWADIFRATHNSVIQIERRRAVNNDEAMRMAARQMRVKVDCLGDPVAGQPLSDASVWKRFVTALTGVDPELGAVALALLGEGDAVTFETITRSRGNTRNEAAALGYAPIYEGATFQSMQSDE